jgi:hypothetical protein
MLCHVENLYSEDFIGRRDDVLAGYATTGFVREGDTCTALMSLTQKGSGFIRDLLFS